MKYLSKRISNLTSLIFLLILTAGTAGLFFYANQVQVVAEGWNDYQFTAEREAGLIKQNVANNTLPVANKNNMDKTANYTTAVLTTSKGAVTFQFMTSDAPNTVANFIKLATSGFYDGTKFHRVIRNFMVQGGDPITKTDNISAYGTGGPGYAFADELNPATASYKTGYVRGTVAMANSGPNTNGSQFFIMHEDNPLPNAYTIFGRVTKGMDVVDAIANVPTDSKDRPTELVTLLSVKVN